MQSKVEEEDYIQYLIVEPGSATCTEAAKVYEEKRGDVAHDAFNRLLHRQPTNTEALWQESVNLVDLTSGYLVIDDSMMDKPYAETNGLVRYLWSGKHRGIVKGINLQTLLWTDGHSLVPCDFRLYQGKEIATKNDTCREMLHQAKNRGFSPKYVLFDTWYSSLDNLKLIHQFKWLWFTRLASNRKVNPDNTFNVPIDQLEIGPNGKKVHLRGYGFIKVFCSEENGEKRYWATNDLRMTPSKCSTLKDKGWKIEVYHRVLKQTCALERSQVRKPNAVHAHVAFSLRAFLRLEFHRLVRSISWYAILRPIFRPFLRNVLRNPPFLLPFPRTA